MSLSLELELIYELALFVAKLIPLVFIGALAANLAVELGFAKRLAKLVSPLLKAAHLPEHLSVPVAVLPLEPRVGHAMLSAMLERGEIGEREVIVSTFLTLPLVIVVFFIPRHYVPVAFPALGVTVAGLYVLCMLAVSSVKMAFSIAYGRSSRLSVAHGPRSLDGGGGPSMAKPDFKEVLRSSVNFAASLTKRVAVRMLAVVAFLAAATYLGLFALVNEALSSVLGFTKLPGQVIAIAATSAISSIAGMALAGAMMAQASITYKEALLGLLLGSLLFRLSSEYPRYSFPFYASIYPVKLAFKLVTLSILIDLPVLLALIAAVAAFM